MKEIKVTTNYNYTESFFTEDKEFVTKKERGCDMIGFKKIGKKFSAIMTMILLMFCMITGYQGIDINAPADNGPQQNVQNKKDLKAAKLDEYGTYTSRDDVVAYMKTYDRLPSNFITKEQAKELGWVKEELNFDIVAPGKSLGGGYFGNYENALPTKEGREYHECDIDYFGDDRGPKRLVYSNDGLFYYTDDHYESFTLVDGAA